MLRLRNALAGCAAAVALTSAAIVFASEPGAPQTEVREGALAGTEREGVERYLGIPFAAPPVGDRRWQEPAAPTPWMGVRDATTYGPACAQIDRSGELGYPVSEDCLTLNVWAPVAHAKPLPVMVWIHGGGHMWGSGREAKFEGTALAKKGVVLVTINYRLGVLGFMAHPELTAESPHHASGNYGILDQVAALEWVRDNIAAFGGDPGNVTIFGESAGAGAVNILQASPLAKGLFHRAIGESTSQMDPDGGMVGRQDLASAGELGVAFGVKLGASSLAELRAMPVDKLLSVPAFFWPTENDGYVLPDLVYNIFAKGAQNDVPTLVGSNSFEGSTIPRDWVNHAPTEQAEFDALYAGAPDVLAQSATDAVQWQMRVWAALQAKTGRAPAYLYWFDRAWPGKPELGAYHGAEIVYVFKTLDTEDQAWTADDRKVSDITSSYWVNFARSGDPNGPDLPHWPVYDDNKPALMRLAPDPGVIATPRAEAQIFLDRYFDKRR
jgi:para-nitrobenzyl esterase